MVNDASRRSHESQDEPRGKPKSVGVYVSERLSFTNLGKTSRGEPRSKPESGNPTFRDCRGARGNVTLSYLRQSARASALSRPRCSNSEGSSRRQEPGAHGSLQVLGGRQDSSCQALGTGGADARDLHFDAAEIRVVILADPVGEIDHASLAKLQIHAAPGPVPAEGAGQS